MASLTHRIEGSELQFVEITLAAGEAVVGEPGAMMFADEAVEMDTRMGDGDDASFFGRIAAGFKRAFTGENFFSSVFANNSSRPLRVAFAAPSPGKIVAVDLASVGGKLICQRGAFLGGTRGVRVGVAFKKRLRAGEALKVDTGCLAALQTSAQARSASRRGRHESAGACRHSRRGHGGPVPTIAERRGQRR